MYGMMEVQAHGDGDACTFSGVSEDACVHAPRSTVGCKRGAKLSDVGNLLCFAEAYECGAPCCVSCHVLLGGDMGAHECLVGSGLVFWWCCWKVLRQALSLSLVLGEYVHAYGGV